MAYAGLLDGGLSVKIGCAADWTGGTERRTTVHGMRITTTNQGIGSCSFWMECADPFSPQTTYPELVHGARISVTHTYDAATTVLYRGFVLIDPRTAHAGGSSVINVECGGPMEVARWRGDVGFVYTERDTDQWFENKNNGKWVHVDTGDRLYLGVDDDTKVPYGKCGAVGYLIYKGADYLAYAPQLYGVKRLRGTVRMNLKEGMVARLAYSSGYKVSREQADYTEIKTWSAGTVLAKTAFDSTSWGWTPPTKGCHYLVLLLWTSNTSGVKVTADRFIEFDNLEMYLGSDTNEKRIDQALVDVANFVGLHTSTLTSPIYSVEQSLAARPMTDPVSAMNTFSLQASQLVEYGWWPTAAGIEFRARPVPTDPTTIRALSNCYRIDASLAGVDWDVRQHPDEGIMRAIRFTYGKRAASSYPAGFPKNVVAPDGPGWVSGEPFVGTNCPVLPVDFTQHNYSDDRAKDIAMALASHLGEGLSSGPVSLHTQTVPVYGTSAPYPVPYLRGGDWVECTQTQTAAAATGPLYITSSTVYVDTGFVDLEVGFAAQQLIEQLTAAGAINKIKLAKVR